MQVSCICHLSFLLLTWTLYFQAFLRVFLKKNSSPLDDEDEEDITSEEDEEDEEAEANARFDTQYASEVDEIMGDIESETEIELGHLRERERREGNSIVAKVCIQFFSW